MRIIACIILSLLALGCVVFGFIVARALIETWIIDLKEKKKRKSNPKR